MIILEKTGYYLSIFVIVAILVLIIISENGLLDYRELEIKKNVIQEQVNQIDSKNHKLENEIISLRSDMNYIKHIAKHEHDMVQKDELIFKNKSVGKGKKNE
jgi:cell division protein FtsB